MTGGEFTHEGEDCTFESMVRRFGLGDDMGLRAIAEIVHEIDLKDSKYGRAETPGIDRLVAGIAMANREDEARIAQGATVFESLYEYFRRRRPESGPERSRG